MYIYVCVCVCVCFYGDNLLSKYMQISVSRMEWLAYWIATFCKRVLTPVALLRSLSK